MSDFSIMCREAMGDAGLSVYKISKNAKLDRTTLQKMVSGEKLPGYSFFYRFMDHLKLNAEQQKRFLEAFQIEKDGFAKCSNRKKLAEIIGSLGKHREFLDSAYFEVGSGSNPAENRRELYSLIYQSMKESIECDDHTVLCMNVPTKLDKIYDIIRLLRKRFQRENSCRFQIRQIVLLNKNPLYSKEANVNLNYLAELLPMADCFGEDYQVHYQYVRGTECDYGLLLWPYYILFPTKILFLSADAGSGWIEERPEILRMARRTFDRQIESAPLLFHVYPDNVEAFSVYCNNFKELKMPSYTLENAPCMTLMYDRQILEQLCAGLPEGYGALVAGAAEYYETAGSMPLTSTMFFAESGLKLFLEQGVVMGGIAEFLGKIPEMSRRPMLARFIEKWRAGGAKIHMLNETFLALNCPLMMEVFEDRKIALFLLSTDRQIVYLEIEEVSICEAINDFLGHLTDLRIAYDGEETERRMREMMQV